LGGPSAYLKISEGCSQRCTFCVIPSLRGPMRSRSVEELVDEAQALARRGVREINLIGQDTTAFGRDSEGKERLPDLLDALDRVDGLEWIRLLYLYPARVGDRLIETIRNAEHICKYVDVPLQHVDNRVLRTMGRGTSERTVRELLERLRAGIPGVTIRTTLLVGFPGETERAFQKLVDFVEENRFERLGVFAFSAEEGTAAALLPQQIPLEVRQDRREVLMEIQSRIHREHNEALLGCRLPVLVEGMTEGPLLVGRTEGQAPEVDGQVIIDGDVAQPGNLLTIEVVGVDGYDLVGKAGF